MSLIDKSEKGPEDRTEESREKMKEQVLNLISNFLSKYPYVDTATYLTDVLKGTIEIRLYLSKE